MPCENIPFCSALPDSSLLKKLPLSSQLKAPALAIVSARDVCQAPSSPWFKGFTPWHILDAPSSRKSF